MDYHDLSCFCRDASTFLVVDHVDLSCYVGNMDAHLTEIRNTTASEGSSDNVGHYIRSTVTIPAYELGDEYTKFWEDRIFRGRGIDSRAD
jgi:hypothetical protein